VLNHKNREELSAILKKLESENKIDLQQKAIERIKSLYTESNREKQLLEAIRIN
jgi:hypothetical protein